MSRAIHLVGCSRLPTDILPCCKIDLVLDLSRILGTDPLRHSGREVRLFQKWKWKKMDRRNLASSVRLGRFLETPSESATDMRAWAKLDHDACLYREKFVHHALTSPLNTVQSGPAI